MPKSDAERSKAYRARNRKALLEKERIRSYQRRQLLTPRKENKQKNQAKVRNQRLRMKKKLDFITNVSLNSTQDNSYNCKSSMRKALNKTKQALPKSPNKRRTILEQLGAEYGLCTAKETHRVHFTSEEIKKVKVFYEREDISVMSPGRKDFMKIDGEIVQKRYLVMNLKELHQLYCEENADKKIKLSKFCELRPTYILTCKDTPLETCGCIYHSNFTYLCAALASKIPFPLYCNKWLENYVLCKPPTYQCWIMKCSLCCDSKLLKVSLPEIGDMDTLITYKWWIKEDHRCVLSQHKKNIKDTFKHFRDYLPEFTEHHLTKKHQSEQYRSQKENLEPGQILIHFDYSQNYTCGYQDAVQAAYWSQSTITLFTVVIYRYQLESKSFVIISDDNDKTKRATTTYLSEIFDLYCIDYLKKVILWSDGPCTQFKNRYMAKFIQHCSVKYHFQSIEWNFFATSHGKGAVDGVGGSLKRFVWNSVKSREVIVLNAKDFLLASNGCKTYVRLINTDDINLRWALIADKIEEAKAVTNITKMHFWQVKNGKFLVSKFSNIL